jgi:hypothetical protein
MSDNGLIQAPHPASPRNGSWSSDLRGRERGSVLWSLKEHILAKANLLSPSGVAMLR